MKFYNVFEGKVPREKIDSFKAGAGTVLFLYDEATVKKMQEQFSTYADNFSCLGKSGKRDAAGLLFGLC